MQQEARLGGPPVSPGVRNSLAAFAGSGEALSHTVPAASPLAKQLRADADRVGIRGGHPPHASRGGNLAPHRVSQCPSLTHVKPS